MAQIRRSSVCGSSFYRTELHLLISWAYQERYDYLFPAASAGGEGDTSEDLPGPAPAVEVGPPEEPRQEDLEQRMELSSPPPKRRKRGRKTKKSVFQRLGPGVEAGGDDESTSSLAPPVPLMSLVIPPPASAGRQLRASPAAAAGSAEQLEKQLQPEVRLQSLDSAVVRRAVSLEDVPSSVARGRRVDRAGSSAVSSSRPQTRQSGVSAGTSLQAPVPPASGVGRSRSAVKPDLAYYQREAADLRRIRAEVAAKYAKASEESERAASERESAGARGRVTFSSETADPPPSVSRLREEHLQRKAASRQQQQQVSVEASAPDTARPAAAVTTIPPRDFPSFVKKLAGGTQTDRVEMKEQASSTGDLPPPPPVILLPPPLSPEIEYLATNAALDVLDQPWRVDARAVEGYVLHLLQVNRETDPLRHLLVSTVVRTVQAVEVYRIAAGRWTPARPVDIDSLRPVARVDANLALATAEREQLRRRVKEGLQQRLGAIQDFMERDLESLARTASRTPAVSPSPAPRPAGSKAVAVRPFLNPSFPWTRSEEQRSRQLEQQFVVFPEGGTPVTSVVTGGEEVSPGTSVGPVAGSGPLPTGCVGGLAFPLMEQAPSTLASGSEDLPALETSEAPMEGVDSLPQLFEELEEQLERSGEVEEMPILEPNVSPVPNVSGFPNVSRDVTVVPETDCESDSDTLTLDSQTADDRLLDTP